MTTSTTNYGWPVPQTSDPVNIPGDMLALGQGADTTVKAIDVRVGALETKVALSQVMHTYTTTTTWTKPATAGYIGSVIEVQAGGGGSGAIPAGTASNGTASGGGQGGQYLRVYLTAAALPSSAVATPGAAGAAGVSAGAGGAGGDSSFGALLIARGGGGGAAGLANGLTLAASLGGANTQTPGGTATPDYNRPGGDGKNGVRYNGILSVGGDGGESQIAGSRRVAGISNGGTAGYNYGGGASGGSGQNAGAANGAAGGAGVIIVTDLYT